MRHVADTHNSPCSAYFPAPLRIFDRIPLPPYGKTIPTNVRLIVVAAASLPNNARSANESGASRVSTDGLWGIKTCPMTRVSRTWGGFKGCNLAFFVVGICFIFADARYIPKRLVIYRGWYFNGVAPETVWMREIWGITFEIFFCGNCECADWN